MSTFTRCTLISRHCEALECVSWFLFGSPDHAPRIAARLAAHLEDW